MTVPSEHGYCHGNGQEAAEAQRPADKGVSVRGTGSREQRSGVRATAMKGQPGPYEKPEKYAKVTEHL